MREEDLHDRECRLIADWRDFLAERIDRLHAERSSAEQARVSLEEKHKKARLNLKATCEKQLVALKSEYEKVQKEAVAAHDQAKSQLVKEEEKARRGATDRYEREMESARQQHQQSRWETQAVYQATKSSGKDDFKKTEHELHLKRLAVDEIQDRALEALSTSWVPGERREITARQDELFVDDAGGKLDATLADAREVLGQLEQDRLLKLVRPGGMWGIFLSSAALGAVIGWLFASMIGALIGALASALILGGGIALGLYLTARKRASATFASIIDKLSDAQTYLQHVRAEQSANYRQLRSDSKKSTQREIKDFDKDFRKRTEALSEEYRRVIARWDEEGPKKLEEITRRRDDALRHAQEKYPPLLRDVKQRYEDESAKLEQQHVSATETLKTSVHRDEQAWRESWNEDLDKFRQRVQAIHDVDQIHFPDWTSRVWEDWEGPQLVPTSVRFGEIAVDPRHLVNRPIPSEPGVQQPEPFTLPATLSFPTRVSATFRATGEGLRAANEALSLTMFRMLTSIPPAKVRFTVIDPVGLGQDFAAFMHLADHDELLVTSRIWTESVHIEQRLVDLTEHMENVIQKYLRNEFETIDQYNQEAGEVAEPYRVVVIASFPVNFSESAMRRLQSIMSAGSRCGVYVLASIDAKQQLPHGFSWKEFESHAVNFNWSTKGFAWSDDALKDFPLAIDAPPPAELATRILGLVGERAKIASRVEVPFRMVAPALDERWQADSRREVRVPLGRAGATKLQYLELGRGTSQHVLIAGKTGSGKSTLLHAMITSTALRYSPDEVEFYLIDFKKGVEFKTYATHELPHARVIAIESEREFGLSVMRRLDEELKIRGDRFRDLGVQDIGGYRDLADKDPALGPMPRILFIVDEFQEFFVADDKIAQDASLLLDRLVRQGRAFGIHVLLGSQTLGGAYSLARSTIGQMAVRIALQCSESDAHLILSEENSAARLLTRPGEAIYNDANGRVEGNNPFQIVWLSDAEKESHLDSLHALAKDRRLPLVNQIVFEGNVAARLEKNPLLARLLSAATWPTNVSRARAWLGEAIEIKDPTSVDFVRQSGSNLLVIGQREESAGSILTSLLASLAVQLAPAPSLSKGTGAIFYTIDGSLTDSPHHGYLDRLMSRFPHSTRSVHRRQLAESMIELHDELLARQSGDPSGSPDVFLVIHDAARLRDFRRNEDDFGFSSAGSDESGPKPDRALAAILKEGPALGIYVILWCDSLANLQRMLDRGSIRELGLRVLFQMSANDSSSLLDSPAASRLDQHRAIFHQEDEGRMEKFRPYGLPSEEWLEQVQARLGGRVSSLAQADAER